jgi:hypothetical protein
MLKDSIVKVSIGALGIGASTAVQSAGDISPDDVNNVVSVVVQILIGLATLFGLLRKKKE